MIHQQNTFSHDISVQELEYLRSQGFNNTQIAQKVGCSIGTVSKYLPSLRKKNTVLTDSDKDDMECLYNAEYSVGYLAARFHCSKPTVYKILKERGIVFGKGKKSEEKDEEKTEAQPDIVIDSSVESKKEEPTEEPQSACLTMREVKIFSGRTGDYLVDPVVHTIRLPEMCKVMDKKEFGFYIRDLMAVWKEM